MVSRVAPLYHSSGNNNYHVVRHVSRKYATVYLGPSFFRQALEGLQKALENLGHQGKVTVCEFTVSAAPEQVCYYAIFLTVFQFFFGVT